MKQQDHNAPNIIGEIKKTTYIDNTYFNENAIERIDGKIKRMMQRDVEKYADRFQIIQGGYERYP